MQIICARVDNDDCILGIYKLVKYNDILMWRHMRLHKQLGIDRSCLPKIMAKSIYRFDHNSVLTLHFDFDEKQYNEACNRLLT